MAGFMRASGRSEPRSGPTWSCGPPPQSPTLFERLWWALAEFRPTPSWWALPAPAGWRKPRNWALRAEELADTVRVMTDGEIALVAAFGQSPGILILAGTGSVGLARDQEGNINRAGGYGWQMGDEGSGYALGRAALGVVGRAADGIAEATGLSERVLTATRSSDISHLVRWAAASGQGEIAALAPLVLEMAESGDRLAAELVARAADDLLNLAISLRRLFPEGDAIPVAMCGGVVQSGPLADALRAMLTDRADLAPVEDAIDPVLGALSLARDLAETGSE